jgi:hypothetical protein
MRAASGSGQGLSIALAKPAPNATMFSTTIRARSGFICRVLSAPQYRNFDRHAKDTTGDDVDIWHYRKIEFATEPIPILDLYGAIKGKLLGPRGNILGIAR